MSTRSEKRQEQDLTQNEAARRAGVSLATWRRWESETGPVSAATDAKCRQVLDREPSMHDWTGVETWRDHPLITPRQAAALVTELNYFADIELADWLDTQREPLHETPPFDQVDRRAMFYVAENKAWVAEARDRCHAVAEQILDGVLPHDQHACFFDEFAVLAAGNVAEERWDDNLSLYEEIPSRDPVESDRDGWMIGDNEWDLLIGWVIDSSRWDVHAVCGPRGQLSGLVEVSLAAHHPLAWFNLLASDSA